MSRVSASTEHSRLEALLCIVRRHCHSAAARLVQPARLLVAKLLVVERLVSKRFARRILGQIQAGDCDLLPCGLIIVKAGQSQVSVAIQCPSHADICWQAAVASHSEVELIAQEYLGALLLRHLFLASMSAFLVLLKSDVDSCLVQVHLATVDDHALVLQGSMSRGLRQQRVERVHEARRG